VLAGAVCGEPDRPDLDDPVAVRVEPGRLEVDRDEPFRWGLF